MSSLFPPLRARGVAFVLVLGNHEFGVAGELRGGVHGHHHAGGQEAGQSAAGPS